MTEKKPPTRGQRLAVVREELVGEIFVARLKGCNAQTMTELLAHAKKANTFARLTYLRSKLILEKHRAAYPALSQPWVTYFK